MAALKNFTSKLTLPKASSWLPAVVALLCLGFFGSAVLVLFSVGADPESGPSPVVTSVAGQGFQGLRRLLTAEGHLTATNRFEDSPSQLNDGKSGKDQVTRGDVEIITFEAYSPYLFETMRRAAQSSSDSASTSSGEGSSSASSGETPASEEAAPDDTDYGPVPNKRHADHVLYRPLGRAVIVILPKWQTSTAPTNGRWGADARLIAPLGISQAMTFLSPMTEAAEKPKPDEKEGAKVPLPAAPPGKDVFDSGDNLITYDKIDYDIRRTRTAGPVTLSSVNGQGVFAEPLGVGRISDLQSVRGPNLVPVLVGPNGEPLISRLTVTGGRPQPKVPVYVVSDPDLLDNQILADPQKVASALEIVDRLSPPGNGKHRASVVFNLTFNNMAFDRDLLHALSRPPFVAVPLSLLLFGLGLMWAAFARFGPPCLTEEGAPLGRGVRILADNAARLMAMTLRETKLGPAYAQMIRDEVLRARGHTRAGPDENADDLADRIGNLSGASDSYTDLKRRSATILTVHQLIDLTQRLHAWKIQIENTEIDRANI
ncbi:MAG TPA: hypothetical protein VG839_02740 [Asticcacaulis sp.]|nr:hypothetical protein [Asticcacaulis sp.]